MLCLPVLLAYRFAHCFRGYSHRSRPKIFLLLPAAVALLLAYYYVSHLQLCPVTGRPRFIAFESDEFNERISADVKAIQKYFWMVSRKPKRQGTYRRLHRTAGKILRANKRLPGMSNKTWSFVVVRSSAPSAFVLPTCRTYVFDGIFKLCYNDDILSFVLAHEMAHCLLEHTLQKESMASLLDKVMSLVWTLSLGIVGDDIPAVLVPWIVHKAMLYGVFLPYIRFMELESDQVGLQMTARSCYDFRYSILYFDRVTAFVTKARTTRTMRIFSTHPTRYERVRYIYRQMNRFLEIRRSQGCGTLPPMRGGVRKRIEAFVNSSIVRR